MISAILFQLLTVVVAQQSGVHLTVLPSESPIITESDSWRCVTKDIRGFFEPPYPTGSLYSARLSYGDTIQTCTLSGIEALKCPFPEKSLWCGFSTAVPANLRDEYISYGSTASSWWAARSSAAVSIAGQCPHSWWLNRQRVSFGANKLNLTIMEAECYAEANPTSGMPVPISTTTRSTSGPTPTSTQDQQNVGNKRAEKAALWFATGTVLTTGAVNSVL